RCRPPRRAGRTLPRQPSCQLSDLEKDHVVFHLHVIGGNGLGGRQSLRLTGAHIESAPVPRALHLVVEQITLRQGGLGVTAAISDGIHIVTDPEESDAVLADVHPQAAVPRDAARLDDLDPAHDRRPSSCASTNRLKTASWIGPATMSIGSRSITSVKKPRMSIRSARSLRMPRLWR